MAKNISKYLAGVSAVSLLANLFAPVISLVSAVDPVSANQDVVFNVNIAKILTVSVTTPGTSAEIDKVTGSGNALEFMTTSFQLNVATNNLTGYKATMTTNSSSTVLQHATSTSDTIANLTGPATGGTTFPANYWGFSLDDSTYNSLKPKGDSDAPVVAQSAGPAEDSQQIYFGMKADGTKPSGDYSNTVLLTVVTNSSPDPTPVPTPTPTPGPDDNPTNNDNGSNSAPARSIARTSQPAQSTESTSSDSSDSYAKPQGVFDETDHDESINATNPAASAALGATAVVAAGVIFFVLAKRREDDDDEQQA